MSKPRVPSDDALSQVGSDERLISELEARLRDMELTLRLHNGQQRIALDLAKLGSWEYDLQTGTVAGTATFKSILGLPADASLTFEQWQQMFHPDDAERIEQAVEYSLKTRTDLQVEYRLLRNDGATAWVLMRSHALLEDGKLIRLIGVLQDVTERARRHEETLLAQHRQEFLLKFNDLVGNQDDPLRIMEIAAQQLAEFLDIDYAGYGEVFEDRGVIVVEREWSRGTVGNHGRIQPIAQITEPIMALFRAGSALVIEDTKTDPRVSAPELQTMFDSTHVRTTVNVPLIKNGEFKAIFYASSSSPRAWPPEDLALIEDVVERTWLAAEKARAERGLRETDARFRILAESLPALVWIINPRLELIYANERWVTYSGLQPEEALGHSWMNAIHPDDMARMNVELQEVISKQIPYVTEARYRSHEGFYRWFLIRADTRFSASGQFEGWVGSSVDIHDIKMTEAALRTNQQQLRLALEAAKMGDWSWDANSKDINLSDRAAEILGLPPGSSITRDELHEQIHPADRARVLSTIQKAFENRSQYLVEYRIIRPRDGSPAWITAQGQPIYNPDASLKGTTGVFQDVTERKHAEERQQLLIRELHHRVKNTLATVQAIVGSTARTATSIDEFYQGFVGRIVSLARTHNLLTEDLWQKADLQELVETELGPYEDEARNRILVEGPPIELPSEAAVPIGMAIHELTTNAAKHGALSTFGGQVEVRWRIEPAAEGPRLHFTWSENGGPRVTAPARQGFGSRLLQRVLTTQLQAQVSMDFREEGLHFLMIMPIPGSPPLFNPDK